MSNSNDFNRLIDTSILEQEKERKNNLKKLIELQKEYTIEELSKKKISQSVVNELKDEPVFKEIDELRNGYLEKLLNIMENEEQDKRKNRTLITKCLLVYFLIITIFVIVVVFFSHKNFIPEKVVLTVVGGFFANIISLLLILLKYTYSPSKELHEFIVDLFQKKNEK